MDGRKDGRKKGWTEVARPQEKAIPVEKGRKKKGKKKESEWVANQPGGISDVQLVRHPSSQQKKRRKKKKEGGEKESEMGRTEEGFAVKLLPSSSSSRAALPCSLLPLQFLPPPFQKEGCPIEMKVGEGGEGPEKREGKGRSPYKGL